MKTDELRKKRICLICEKNTTRQPWNICQACGDFIVINWNAEAYRV